MLTLFGRRGWPHLSGSSWSPRRNGAAGDGGEGLLGVLLVSWQGSGEVEGVVLVERELRMAIYSRPEEVPANGITPAAITVLKWPDDWFKRLGINVEIH